MPMIIKGFLLFFGPVLAMIALIAFAAFLRELLRRRHNLALAASGPAVSADEMARAATFRTRRRRFRLWLWSGLAGALAALGAGWYLTAFAAGALAPLAAAIIHLRCPACDTTPTITGLSDRGRCRRCGAYLG